MEQFMRKYSYIVTSCLGVIAIFVLIFSWNRLSMLQKLPIMYIIALAVHELEELKFPGGFVEQVAAMTGMKANNLGVAEFALLLFTLYATLIPAFLSNFIWPVMATMMIGVVELVAHLAAARVNKKHFYSAGMITAIVVQFPVAVYGFWYLISNSLVRWYYWLIALVFLFVPLLGAQFVIVKSNGVSYGKFWKDAVKSMATRRAQGQQEQK